jgi:TM2 domain-containing membrane protein YozV
VTSSAIFASRLDRVLLWEQDAHTVAQQPPNQSAGQVSPDGKWRWDGQQWIPNVPVLMAGGAYVVSPQPGALVVAPKNPAVSLIISFFLPGVGSMVNGDAGIGIAILLLYLVGVILSFFLIGIPLAIGAWIWGLIDAYQGAQRWNRAHGILS